MDLYIIWQSEELFPLMGRDSIPEYGKENKDKIGYLAYLLSKNNIFLAHLWIDDDYISVILIDPGCSDLTFLSEYLKKY